jgi:hypothetical protein
MAPELSCSKVKPKRAAIAGFINPEFITSGATQRDVRVYRKNSTSKRRHNAPYTCCVARETGARSPGEAEPINPVPDQIRKQQKEGCQSTSADYSGLPIQCWGQKTPQQRQQCGQPGTGPDRRSQKPCVGGVGHRVIILVFLITGCVD